MRTGTIEQWSTYSEPDFFKAPEQMTTHIQGVCEGRRILTSRLIRVDGRVVFTKSGSRYELGEPHPKFVEWLRENNYPFDPENPIRMVAERTVLPPPKVTS